MATPWENDPIEVPWEKDMAEPQPRPVGAVEAALLQLEGAVPFGRTINSTWARLLSKEGRRKLAAKVLTPAGQEAWLGLTPEQGAALERQAAAEGATAAAAVKQRQTQAWKDQPVASVVGAGAGYLGTGAVGRGLGAARAAAPMMGQAPAGAATARTLSDVGGRYNALYRGAEMVEDGRPLPEAVSETVKAGAIGAAGTAALGAGAIGLGRAGQDVAGAMANRYLRLAGRGFGRAMRNSKVGDLAVDLGRPEEQATLDTGLRLPGAQLRKGVESIYNAALANRKVVGPPVEAVTTEATKRGAKVDILDIIDDFTNRLPDVMTKDPAIKPYVTKAQEYLLNAALERSSAGTLTATDAHKLRQQLDLNIFGVGDDALGKMSGKLRPLITDARRALDGRLSAAIGDKGLRPQWESVNSAYARNESIIDLSKEGFRNVNRGVYAPEPKLPFRARMIGMKVQPVAYMPPPKTPGRYLTAMNTRVRQGLGDALRRVSNIGVQPAPGGVPVRLQGGLPQTPQGGPPQGPGRLLAVGPIPPGESPTFAIPGAVQEPAPGFTRWTPPTEGPALTISPSRAVPPPRRGVEDMQRELSQAQREALLRAVTIRGQEVPAPPAPQRASANPDILRRAAELRAMLLRAKNAKKGGT